MQMNDAQAINFYPFKNKPYLHQMAYLQRFWEEPVAALFAEMGTGKSFMAINNAAMLYDNGHINALLVVAPKGVYRNWANQELPKHLPDHITYKPILWTPNPNRKEREALDSLFESMDEFKVFIMNIEAFSTDKGADICKRFLLSHDAMMVVDESTTIKSPKAQRTKTICKLGKLAKYRRILTGSPVTKSPLDLYTQCYFLDPALLDSPSYFAFQTRYAVTVKRTLGPRSFNQIVGYRRLDELTETLNRFSYRVTKAECLDLPPKIYIRREVALTKEQAKAYEQMKKMALVMLENGEMTTTATALTQILRLQQICCGHIKTDAGTVELFPNNRVSEMLEVLEEVDGKVIIWATFTQDIHAIRDALTKTYGPGTVACYYGETEDHERAAIVENFQNPEHSLRFFVGQPRTGGYGLTLTQAHTMIYYSNSYDLEIRLQSEDRAHRIGQEKPVTYIDLVSPNTVDERILQALRSKIDIATTVLGEEFKEWLI